MRYENISIGKAVADRVEAKSLYIGGDPKNGTLGTLLDQAFIDAVDEVQAIAGLTASAAELNFNDGTTIGTVVASKTVAVDANKDVAGFRNVTLGINGAAGVAGGLLVKDGANPGATATIDYADIAKIDGITNGTAAASKAVVLDASSKIDTLDITTPKFNGTTVGSTAAEIDAVADLSASGAVHKIKKIAISATPTGAEQDTGWDLPAKAVVHDTWVDSTTAEVTGGTKTLDIGTKAAEGGDADGWLDGVSVAATGLKKGAFVQTTGSLNNYVGAAATHTRGELLTELLIAGEDVTSGGDGVAVPGFDVASGGKSVVYTSGSADWAEFRGAIYIEYSEVA